MPNPAGGITGPILVDTGETLAQQRADQGSFAQVVGTLVPLGGPNGSNGPAPILPARSSGPREPGQ